MVNVMIYRDNQNYIQGYEVEGHADYDDYGKDIVCSAVSVLAQTTLLSLVEVCGVPEKDIEYAIVDEIGYLEIKLPKNIENKILEKSQTVLQTFELGIKSIIESYGEHVTLKYREV